MSYIEITEGSKAKVVQVMAGSNIVSLLTPSLASKNDAIHGIGLPYYQTIDAKSNIDLRRHFWRRKGSENLYLQSIAQLRFFSLEISL